MTAQQDGRIPQPIFNVAIIGVGEVAMTVHLPTLLQCSHMYRTVALVDISRHALDHCSKKYHVPNTYTDVGEMLSAQPELDLVMIMNANEYHVPHAVQCLRAGKNVLIEKPMAITLEGADEIVAAQKESGKVVFVGYMRRYAAAFLRVKEIVKGLEPGAIRYVRVRDIIGSVSDLTALALTAQVFGFLAEDQNAFFVNQSATFPKQFTDFPDTAAAERKTIGDSLFASALGDKSFNPSDRLTWNLLNGLGTHDISAMRELLGTPKRVLSATRSAGGRFMTVLFEYDGFVAFYEMGIDQVRVFDAHIEIFAGDQRIKVNYDTPYIKGLPVTATILRSDTNGDHQEINIRPTYEDPYTLEYKALYDNLRGESPVKTTAEDAKQDLEILTMIWNALDK